MALLKKPSEIGNNLILSGLIYGQPGVGKSTVALSAPNPVMIDADNGMQRVKKRYQVPSLQMNKYASMLELLASDELDEFDSIVIDTIGKFIEKVGDWLCEQEPKNRKRDGALSLQGYGALNNEFKRFVRLVKDKGKHLIFVAHEKEEKDGEIRVVRIDSPGSSAKDLVKELDFMGYMEMHGERRTVSFSPTEKFYAKNAVGLPGALEVPDPDKVGNDFIQKHIIERAKNRLIEDEKETAQYNDLCKKLDAVIASAKDTKTADAALDELNKFEPIWDSHRQAKVKMNEALKKLSIAFNVQTKKFEQQEKKNVSNNANPAQ